MLSEIINNIKTLKSVHDSFNGQSINPKDMDIIINCSMKAANASNLQRYSMILLDDTDLIQELTGKKTADKAIVYCLDYNRIMATAEYMNLSYIPGVDNWYDILSGIFDVSALAQTAVITAHGLGIDSLITNGVLRQDQKKVKEKLNLPHKYCIAVMAVLFGYSDEPRVEVKNRLPAECIVHKNKYKGMSTGQLKRIVGEFDEIYPDQINNNNRHYLDWFFTEWCKPRSKEMKADLKKIISEAGFVLE